jgi:tRNA dimethylallyltransferase
MDAKHLIVIGGPTAVGKTDAAIQVATDLQTDIVSADSRQLYKELGVAVAKPDQKQLESVKHHFISSHSIQDLLSAGAYAVLAQEKLRSLFKQHHWVVMAGGSGFYIKAVLDGLDELPAANSELRIELNRLYEREGISALQDLYLKSGGKKVVDSQNPQRLIRAIEISRSGLPEKRDKGRQTLPYSAHCYYLNTDRKELYHRINQRVDQMLESGLIQEARSLDGLRNISALQTVGYQELFRYFDGELSLIEALELIKKNSRNYAKRQLTWFRNDKRFKEAENAGQILADLKKEGLL